MTEAKSATECIIFIPFHDNDKSRTPPLSGFLFLNSVMTKALHPCKCVIVRLSTHVQLHACITKWLMQLTLGLREISHDAAQRHSVWLTSEWGAVWGLAGRRDVSWHVAESVIVWGRPGTQKIELISTSFSTFLHHFRVSHWGLDFISWLYCHLSQVQVSTWLIMWSLPNTAEHFCLSLFKPTFTVLSKSNMASINSNVLIHNKCSRYSLSRLYSPMNTLT